MPRTTDKQEKILEYLNDYVNQKGYPPSIREICAAVGLRSTATVSYHLTELKKQGKIQGENNKRRAISLPETKRQGRIPVVGMVQAGMPVLAVEQVEETIPWDGDPACFALRVRGDSMINAGILEGDKVVVRPQAQADHGEIVVALLDNEATVKRLRLDSGKVWLMPENPAYPPIPGETASIVGKVMAVFREY